MLNYFKHSRRLADSQALLLEDGPIIAPLRALGLQVDVLEKNGHAARGLPVTLHMVQAAKFVSTSIRTASPDIVVTNSQKAHAIVAATRRPGQPWMHLAYVRDRISADYLGLGKRLVANTALRTVDGVIGNSLATLETIKRTPREKIRAAIPSAIVPPTYSPRRTLAQDAYALVGRVSPWKGQHLAVEALSHPDLPSSVQLHIVGGALFGEEEYERHCKALARRLGVEDRITWHGHVLDPYEILAYCSGLLHTSIIPEPFGQVVVQGMAAGLPVIAANAGGPRETITDGVNGFLYEQASVQDLVRVWSMVHKDKKLANSVREGAIRRSRDYDPTTLANQLDDMIEGLLDAKR